MVSHHPTDSLTAGWLGGLGPAKESRSGARQAKVQVEGIAYSFCGLWISSVLACLCVTSELNGPWFDSWWSLCLMGPEKKSTTESFGSPLDGGRPQVHHGKLWLSVGWWPTTGPPRKALALRWMVADHRSTTESFGSPLDGGPPQVHHGKLWLCLGRLGPAKESTLAPYFPGVQCNKEVQVEGIAYSFCGLWISSVLACLCVTSQLNSTVPGSIPGDLSVCGA